MDDIERALHALLGYAHLDLAGVRRMSPAEEQLADDLSEWYETTGRALAAARRSEQ